VVPRYYQSSLSSSFPSKLLWTPAIHKSLLSPLRSCNAWWSALIPLARL
jgi:hypothetical protein